MDRIRVQSPQGIRCAPTSPLFSALPLSDACVMFDYWYFIATEASPRSPSALPLLDTSSYSTPLSALLPAAYFASSRYLWRISTSGNTMLVGLPCDFAQVLLRYRHSISTPALRCERPLMKRLARMFPSSDRRYQKLLQCTLTLPSAQWLNPLPTPQERQDSLSTVSLELCRYIYQELHLVTGHYI